MSLDVNFNVSLTNDVVSFEQLGPVHRSSIFLSTGNFCLYRSKVKYLIEYTKWWHPCSQLYKIQTTVAILFRFWSNLFQYACFLKLCNLKDAFHWVGLSLEVFWHTCLKTQCRPTSDAVCGIWSSSTPVVQQYLDTLTDSKWAWPNFRIFMVSSLGSNYFG